MSFKLTYEKLIQAGITKKVSKDFNTMSKDIIAALERVKAEFKRVNAEAKKLGTNAKSLIQLEKLKAQNERLKKSNDALKSSQVKLSQAQKIATQLERQLTRERIKATPANRKLIAETKRLRAETNKLTAVNKKQKSSVGGLAGALTKAGLAMASLIGGIALAARGIKNLIKNIFTTTIALDSLSYSMQAVITDAGDLAVSQSYLISLAKRYGSELISTTQSYIRFRAAVKQANITANQSRDIFESVTKAGAVLGLSQQRLELAFLALEQMASKGCHAKGTKVLMYDRSIKLIEDIIIGDFLMGDDYTSRKVFSLANGFDDMYDIIPIGIEKFNVNKNHIIPLRNKNTGIIDNIKIIDIVNKYFNYQVIHKELGYIDFELKYTGVDEYFGIELMDNHLFLLQNLVYQHNTVSMEELRRQLGDQLPGAVNIMADALDVSVPKMYKMIKANEVLAEDALPKFARQLEIAYGITNVNKVDTINAAIGRLKSGWISFVDALNSSKISSTVVNTLASIVDQLGRMFRSDYENTIIDQFDDASKAAKRFTTELQQTTKERIKYFNDEIKILKRLNNNIQEGTDEYQANISKIGLMRSKIKDLEKDGKDVFKGEDLAMELRIHLEEYDKEMNEYAKLERAASLRLKELEAEKFVALPRPMREIKADIEEVNEEINGYLSQRAWYKTYKEQIQNAIQDAQKPLESFDEILGDLGKKQKELEDITKIQPSLSGKALDDANRSIEILKNEIKLLEERGTLIAESDEAKRYLEEWKIVNKSRLKDNEYISDQIYKDEIARINYIFEQEDKILQLTLGLNEDYYTELANLDSERRGNLKELDSKYLSSQAEMLYDDLALWEETNRSIFDDAVKLTKALAEEEVDRINKRRDLEIEALTAQFEASEKTIKQTKEYETELLKLYNKAADDISKVWGTLSKEQVEGVKETLSAVKELFDSAADVWLAYNDSLLIEAETQLSIHEKAVSDLESRLDKEYQLKQEGKNNEYDLLVSQKAKEEKLAQEAFERLKKLRKQEAAIQFASQTASLITASAKIFEKSAEYGPVAGTILALSAIGTMIASFIGYKNKIKSIEAEEPGFAKGVIKYKGKGGRKSDSNRVWISRDESIITAEGTDNAPETLKLINEGKLKDADILNNIWKLNFPRMGRYHQESMNLKELTGEIKTVNNSIVEQTNWFKNKDAQILEHSDHQIRYKIGNKIVVQKF